MRSDFEHLVVIGGTAAGLSAASKAKRLCPSLKVSIIERTGYTSYGSCGMPYYIGNKIDQINDLITFTPEQLSQERKMDVYIKCEATKIDKINKTIHVNNLVTGSSFALYYDKLVIATGASSVIPRIDGIDCEGVFKLRSIEDATAVKTYLQSGNVKKVVVVGAGYIGLEVASELTECGFEVVVAEALSELLPYLNRRFAKKTEALIRERGIDLRLLSKVSSVKSNDGRVSEAVLDDGQNIECQMIILAAGVKPNSSLAFEAGLDIGSFGGIVTDDSMKTSDPCIWACGDCIETKNIITGKPEYMPLGTHANKQGKVAGAALAGHISSFPGVIGTQIVKIFDYYLASTGLNEHKAIAEGKPVQTVSIDKLDKASYYPGGRISSIYLVFDRTSGQILGAQVFGGESSAGRINTLAAAITGKMTVKDLSELDLAYSPPVAPVYDPIIIAAEQALKLIGAD